jgi:hypothetical protein
VETRFVRCAPTVTGAHGGAGFFSIPSGASPVNLTSAGAVLEQIQDEVNVIHVAAAELAM